MLEFFFGVVGMLFVVVAFIAGFVFATKVEEKQTTVPLNITDGEMTKEEIEKKRKEVIAENKAFNDQMGYSIATAYRMEQVPEDGELI